MLEREPKAAAFFGKFPRYRQLISVNKRFCGSDHLDYNLRFDWNSLLADPSHRGQVEVYSRHCLRHNCTPSTSASAIDDRSSSVATNAVSPADSWSWTSPSATVRAIEPSTADVPSFLNDSRLLFREWSKDYYPDASDLQSYLQWCVTDGCAASRCCR